MRVSVPSSWLCRAKKFWLDLRSGYFSTVTRSRDSAPESWFCAAWNRSSALGSLSASGVSWIEEALARARVTFSSTVRSCAANPFPVSTRFGLETPRRGPFFWDPHIEKDQLVVEENRPGADPDHQNRDDAQGDDEAARHDRD